MIPDEAVEAAAKAAYEVQPVELFGEEGPVTWEQLGESILGRARKHHEFERAKQALEALAPNLLVQVWDEGYTTGNAHNGRRDANPYRKPDDARG